MRFKLTETQTVAYRQAFYGDKRVIVFGGAIRGGKTYWLLLTLTSLCLTYPRSRWAVIRKSLPDLKRTTFPSFASIMMDGVSNYVKNWNRETNVITFTNGSELIFMAESFDDDKDLFFHFRYFKPTMLSSLRWFFSKFKLKHHTMNHIIN